MTRPGFFASASSRPAVMSTATAPIEVSRLRSDPRPFAFESASSVPRSLWMITCSFWLGWAFAFASKPGATYEPPLPSLPLSVLRAPAASGITSVSAATTAMTPPRPPRPHSAFARLPLLPEPQSALARESSRVPEPHRAFFLSSVGLLELTFSPSFLRTCGVRSSRRKLVREGGGGFTLSGLRPKDPPHEGLKERREGYLLR